MKYYEKLIKIRKELKWSQAMLASKMNLKQSEIARVESGRGNPTLKKLMKMAKAMHHNILIDFIPKTSDKNPPSPNKNIPAKD